MNDDELNELIHNVHVLEKTKSNKLIRSNSRLLIFNLSKMIN